MTYAITHKPEPPPQPLAQPIRRRSFANESLIEKFDQYLTVMKFSPHTRTRYIYCIKEFGKSLGDRNFTAVKSLEVRAWLTTFYERQFQKGTMNSALCALRAFYRFLQLGKQVLVLPPYQVLLSKTSKRLPFALSEEEMERLLAAAGTPRNLALLELAYASGLRVSELANLRVEEVNLKARSLMVRNGKWGRDRLALFGRPAAQALRAYLGERTSGFVFQPESSRQRGGVWRGKYGIWFGQWRETDADGNRVMRTVRLGDYEISTRERARLALDTILSDKLPPAPPAKEVSSERRLTSRSILRMVVKVAKRAGIEKRVGVHTLRHSFATVCLNRGMDIRHIQALMGHTTLTWTQKYLHVSINRLQEVHRRCLKRG